MTGETQRRIIKVMDLVLTELSNASGYEFDYEKAIGFLREYGGKKLSTLLLEWISKLLPVSNDEVSIKPEELEARLAELETREKAEALLLTMPEPNPLRLNQVLDAVNSLLPIGRQVLLPFAKRLPHDPGGRPEKFPDPSDRYKIRQDIGKLLATGVMLKDAQTRMAKQLNVSLTTIQRVWRERKKK